MNVLRLLVVAVAVASICSTAGAQAFTEDFESYAAGTDLQNVGGWKGWDNTPGASAPVSDAFAYSGANSVEIVPSADLVHEFDIAGGKWVFSTMMYIPSGTSGTSYFILLNSYDDGANQDWSVQTLLDLGAGTLSSYYVAGSQADIIYDEWIELKLVIDLDENTVDEFYNGVEFASHQWDDTEHDTIGAVDLFGNNASSIYYDDIMIQSYIMTLAAASAPSPANAEDDARRDVVLEWNPGVFAATHDVYFGTDFDAVTTADRGNPMDVLLSEGQATTTFDPEGLLEFGQTYYWRVDEVNAAPDNTIFKGSVWTLTAEPFVYPIENITVTSNTTPEGNAIPENTINGSGLNENDEHSRDDDAMWLGTPGDEPAYIQYEFDRVYKLYEMLVWNYNGEFELILPFGIKDVTVEYSEDGEAWTVLDDVTLAQGTSKSDYVANTTIDFAGVGAKFVRLTVNSGYSTIGRYGLSEVRFLYVPAHAREPQPTDEATEVDINTMLTWRAGREAASHDVYFGTDSEALELAATTTAASYTPDALDLATTYYWQVDEVNEAEAVSTWEGSLWSFATQPFIVVEDFESYDDDANRIYETWLDGWVNDTGSTVGYAEAPFAEQTIVKSGGQSMPLLYDNADSATSETEFELGQNWTTSGIQSLSLYFYGDPDNTGQLYIKINNTKVVYDGDAADISKAIWQVWNIDLSTTGASLSSVSKLTIGIEGANAAGVLYIDDIRLYPLAPEYIVPTEPDAANLVALYAFEGNLSDSAGAHPGTAMGDAQTTSDPTRGQVLSLDGDGDAVDIAYSEELNPEAFTASLWANPNPTGSGHRSPITSRDDGPQRGYIIYIEPGNAWQFWTGTGSAWNSASGPAAQLGEWTHVAASFGNEQKKFYINGRLVGESTAPISLNTQQPLRIGAGATEGPGDFFFPGMIDEVRIYNRALSAAEVAGLAGLTEPMHKPF